MQEKTTQKTTGLEAWKTDTLGDNGERGNEDAILHNRWDLSFVPRNQTQHPNTTMKQQENDQMATPKPTDQDTDMDIENNLKQDPSTRTNDQNKQQSDAEQETSIDPESEDDRLLQDDVISEEQNGMESGTDGILDTDSQAEERPQKLTRRTRRCNQWTLAVTQLCTKERNPEKKKDKKSKRAKDDHRTQTKIILRLQNENKALKEKLYTMTSPRESNNDDMENNRQKIRDLEAEIDVLVAQIEENDKKSKPTKKRNGETKNQT